MEDSIRSQKIVALKKVQHMKDLETLKRSPYLLRIKVHIAQPGQDPFRLLAMTLMA